MDTQVLLLPLLSADTPVLDMDMPDTTASVRLKPKLIPMLVLTLSLRSLLDSPSITPLLPDMPTMLELSPDTDLMLLPPTPDMLVLDMLVMLDILAMLVLDTLVLAILVPTMVKLGRD